MIITRAPVRISFVGGGTDLQGFYTRYPGRVISTAINKHVYVIVNRPPLVRHVSARYGESENVDHPSQLKNSRIREALLHFGILSHINVATFPDVPVKTGLGSSSSFSVALMKALLVSQGKKVDKREVAELASHLEIDLVKDPIGKQDQYAAAFGGFNIFQFNPDHSVDVTPVRLDFKKRFEFENHLLVFYTGISRLASSVLTEQNKNIERDFETLKKISDSVLEFEDKLMKGDLKGLGTMLHEGWLRKRTLASNVSNQVIDDLYEAGTSAGAWGGKILGAGGGGCILFMVPPARKERVRENLKKMAVQNNLHDFMEIPIRLAQAGVEVLMNQNGDGNVPKA